jgi:hypothetical protein
MPDISMCANYMCKKRFECFRYIATPSDMQSYFRPDMEEDNDGCKYFNGHKCIITPEREQTLDQQRKSTYEAITRALEDQPENNDHDDV